MRNLSARFRQDYNSITSAGIAIVFGRTIWSQLPEGIILAEETLEGIGRKSVQSARKSLPPSLAAALEAVGSAETSTMTGDSPMRRMSLEAAQQETSRELAAI